MVPSLEALFPRFIKKYLLRNRILFKIYDHTRPTFSREKSNKIKDDTHGQNVLPLRKDVGIQG